ncbi:MAG: F0F1 ATP synthase subunit gamma [Alphaproteobacteria bacterium]|nr:F0F1 ATP synthase subunit gamma [Alphaproteobacteria bacterium]
MATLKALRDRRKSVLSTQKITMAMKMVAGAKLRRAQEQVEASRPYAFRMREMLRDLAENTQALESPQPLLIGTGKTDTHLIVIATSDRGLCGPFNSSLIRHSRKLITSFQGQGQRVKLFCVGRKGKEVLSREYKDLIVESFTEIGHPRLRFSEAQRIADSLLNMYEDGLFDMCTIIFNHFKSAMIQEVTTQQLIPVRVDSPEKKPSFSPLKAIYEYEPSESTILDQLLPQNIAVQVYNALLENAASEQGARMTAMDSANRNAGDMIRKLTLAYNRTRQAHITRELIEIISGAEALH